MQLLNGLIFSQDTETVLFFRQICKALHVNLDCNQDIKEFLLRVMEKEFRFFIFDCGGLSAEGLGWVKLVRHMRPKIPLIILCNDVDQEVGGRLLEEGIFYLAIRPFQRNVFTQVLSSALNLEK